MNTILAALPGWLLLGIAMTYPCMQLFEWQRRHAFRPITAANMWAQFIIVMALGPMAIVRLWWLVWRSK